MSNKLLFGKELASYDNDDLDELLSKLTDEEIQQLNEDLDPDNNLLPPSQRCKDQTTKAPTGRFDREKLIKFLIDKAKAEKDWDEHVPYEKKSRGTLFIPKKLETHLANNDLADMGFDFEFDEDVNEALNKATEDELVSLAAVLGFTGMLNQVQYHAGVENHAVEGGGFTSVAKAERFKPMPDEPPNTTNVEESIKKLEANDPELKQLNLNNIKTMSAEVIKRLCAALKDNHTLEELHMASTGLTPSLIDPMFEALEANSSLKSLNVDSNFLSGANIIRLTEAATHEKSAIVALHLSNQRQAVLGIKVETQLTAAILANPRLTRLGVDVNTPEARFRIQHHIKSNLDKSSRLLRRNKD